MKEFMSMVKKWLHEAVPVYIPQIKPKNDYVVIQSTWKHVSKQPWQPLTMIIYVMEAKKPFCSPAPGKEEHYLPWDASDDYRNSLFPLLLISSRHYELK